MKDKKLSRNLKEKSEVKHRELPTKQAHLWWAIGIALGAVIRHLLDGFPYEMFGTFWTFGFLGVGTKNLLQKRKEYNGK